MIIKKVIEKIEGEATLDLEFNKGVISSAKIIFDNFRGVENILIGKEPRDALVITPRVCGICNHAHLQATVKALEDGYRRAGVDIELTNKAKILRNFTLSCEIIQNHIKWFYLNLIPSLNNLTNTPNIKSDTLKALFVTQNITKASALFSGQWPHSSYCVVGGVTCDPTFIEILQAKTLLDEVGRFIQNVLVGIDIEEFLDINSAKDFAKIEGDLGKFLRDLSANSLSNIGKSKDRFITFGESCGFISGKSIATKYSKVDTIYLREHIQEESISKAVTYRCKFYESGPLARAVIKKDKAIMSLRKRYKDSITTRVYARVKEIASLLKYAKTLLDTIDPSEKSCVVDAKTLPSEFKGIGIVEAARGSLIHKIEVNNSKIKNYDIITPTQWNLSNSLDSELGVAVEAMIGSKSEAEAELILRSFDVCSVCTVQ